MKKQLLLSAGLMAIAGIANAQLNVGSNTAPNSSAMLQVSGTNKGFLPPVMTALQRDAITSPATGLVLFNSTSNQMEVNTGTPAVPAWTKASAASAWSLNGNAGTVAGVNFLGTTDAVDLSLRTSNADRMTITAAGQIGIGTAAPIKTLHVTGEQIISESSSSLAGMGLVGGFPSLLTLNATDAGSHYGLGFITEDRGKIATWQTLDNALEFDHFTTADGVQSANYLLPYGGFVSNGINGASGFGMYLRGNTVNIGEAFFDDAATGVARMTINYLSGYVGIGDTTPVAPLHVMGASSTVLSGGEVDAQLMLSPTGSPNARLCLGYDNTNEVGVISAMESGSSFKNLVLQAPLSGGNPVNVLAGWDGTTVDNGFKLQSMAGFLSKGLITIGIPGMTADAASNNYGDLNIVTKTGNQNKKIILYDNGAATAGNAFSYYGLGVQTGTALRYNVDFTGSAHVFSAGNTASGDGTAFNELMRIQGDGKVGIGAPAPSEKLDVAGAVKVADGGYSGITAGAATPMPSGGAGTIMFQASDSHFYGYNGSVWKQLDN